MKRILKAMLIVSAMIQISIGAIDDTLMSGILRLVQAMIAFGFVWVALEIDTKEGA